ncbi:MAG: Lrp/AsnC ligand binding domain-containing protein [Candidatus Nanoarchaeia archaeon]|jgi:DNA-binding Lrp family transcriptional regulator
MVTSYLLINTKPGAETKVAEELIKRKEVKDINIVYGAYDIIIKIEVKSMDALQEFTLNMRKDVDVEQTSTLISTATR